MRRPPLGAPTPIDGYANGWRVQPGCTEASFTFAPNRVALVGYAVSAATCLVCLVLIAVGWRRRRSVGGKGPERTTIAHTPTRSEASNTASAPARALTVAVAAAIVFGFVFGVVAGIVAVPVVALVLWRGIGARGLTLAAAALLGIVVPILYVVHPGDEAGGNHFGYAMGHLGAHYVAVAALGLLMLALWRSLQRGRGGVAR